MLDIGFGELILIAAIALIAIGPKQLPEVARVIGRLLNELRRATGELSRSVMAEHSTKGHHENRNHSGHTESRTTPSRLENATENNMAFGGTTAISNIQQSNTQQSNLAFGDSNDEFDPSQLEFNFDASPVSPAQECAAGPEQGPEQEPEQEPEQIQLIGKSRVASVAQFEESRKS